jgi:hypothetical protein
LFKKFFFDFLAVALEKLDKTGSRSTLSPGIADQEENMLIISKMNKKDNRKLEIIIIIL